MFATVIPAKAGIHASLQIWLGRNREDTARENFSNLSWMPACAGMT